PALLKPPNWQLHYEDRVLSTFKRVGATEYVTFMSALCAAYLERTRQTGYQDSMLEEYFTIFINIQVSVEQSAKRFCSQVGDSGTKTDRIRMLMDMLDALVDDVADLITVDSSGDLVHELKDGRMSFQRRRDETWMHMLDV
ncbi:hypothetical protein MPER_01310, partial [Moniliophthora perniciosa FA553]